MNAREAIWNKARTEPKIYLHWTAGRYETCFSDYHINITGDGNIYVSTEDLSEALNHTWRRNSGSIGIALCCGYGAGSTSLGSYPPTAKQIEVMAQVIDRVATAGNDANGEIMQINYEKMHFILDTNHFTVTWTVSFFILFQRKFF